VESLTPRPGIREQHRSDSASAPHLKGGGSTPESRHAFQPLAGRLRASRVTSHRGKTASLFGHHHKRLCPAALVVHTTHLYCGKTGKREYIHGRSAVMRGLAVKWNWGAV
jgi:hypothetical protein